MKRNCPLCGQGKVRRTNVRGTSVPFKDEPAVRIDDELELPVCDHCGETFMSGRDAERYDAVVRRAYEAQRLVLQRKEIGRALVALNASQTELEALLGVSQGYISKLLRGEKITSATTIRFLHVLSNDPRALGSLVELVPMSGTLLARICAEREGTPG